MDHPLTDDVLMELGKVTWSAICLEDFTDSLCASVHYANPRKDPRQIGQKIKDARRDLRSWDVRQAVEPVDAWLERARDALDQRNAMLHSVPLTVFDSQGQPIGHALGEMPRRGSDYFERHLTVDALSEVRNELDAAQQGWREVILLASEHHP